MVGFAIYLSLAALFFARTVAAAPSNIYIGRTADPSVYMWSMVWWPYALAHRLNPFLTHALWAPAGFNLAWTTSMPLASLLAAPLTWYLGPVAAYNLLCVVAAPLAGWAAFLVCREAGAESWPSIAGGYIFGFSAYMLAELRAHLVLVLIFPIALAAWLVMRRLNGRIGDRAFVIALALVLIAQAGFELELFATLTLFGGAALVLGYLFAANGMRLTIRRLLAPIIAAYAIALVLMIPYFYYFFQPGFPRAPINSPKAYSTDLLNLIIPTTVNQLGTAGFLRGISRNFPGALIETGGYIGLPLLIVTAAFLYTHRRCTVGKTCAALLLVTLIATLGPRLHFDGHVLFGMPWKLAEHLPLLDNALPARFMIFAFLTIAVTVALWLSDHAVNRWIRIGAIVLIAVSILPNLDPGFWTRAANTPQFFTGGMYRTALAPGENVIVIPYGPSGNSMLWQAQSRMYFRMAGGWTSITPREFQSWPIVDALWKGTSLPDAHAQLEAFMAAHGVSAIIAADFERARWAPLLDSIDPAPQHIGGVTIYRPSGSALEKWQGVSAAMMQVQSTSARFQELLKAASTYIAEGHDVQKLTPLKAEKLGLLPPGRVSDNGIRTHNGLFLGPIGSKIGVGVVGPYDAVKPIIERYGAAASAIYFPFPHKLSGPPRGNTFMRLLVMTFDRGALRRAADPTRSPLGHGKSG
jgi:hypothetical protein